MKFKDFYKHLDKTLLSLVYKCIKMRFLFVFTLYLLVLNKIYGRVLKVGSTHPYANIAIAANQANPGDSIICYDAVLQGGMFINNLKGTLDQWIYILAVSNGDVIIRGGSNSIQFSDAAYIHFEGFIIEGQTGNGLNIDDGGSFDTPTHHIRIKNCTFRNINASGNNDLLKLSGLDDFEIEDCIFLNGASGGSGIDMVGCHHGKITGNSFTNMGSNSIQAKGGTSEIEILRNTFENGGARALNLGGSTGLAFFRPQNATAEAERIKVIANVIQGSEASIAYVGCRNVEVSNNTILFPRKWIIRILQETVDPTRFLPCGDNRFFNNLVIIDQNVSIESNIGPNTAPETFGFDNNLWWKTNNPNWTGPNLPGQVKGSVIADPMIAQNSKYQISSTSPAIALGLPYDEAVLDIEGQTYNDPPSVGAYEGRKVMTAFENEKIQSFKVFPSPAKDEFRLTFPSDEVKSCLLYDQSGNLIQQYHVSTNFYNWDVSFINSGLYVLVIKYEDGRVESTRIFVIQ